MNWQAHFPAPLQAQELHGTMPLQAVPPYGSDHRYEFEHFLAIILQWARRFGGFRAAVLGCLLFALRQYKSFASGVNRSGIA